MKRSNREHQSITDINRLQSLESIQYHNSLTPSLTLEKLIKKIQVTLTDGLFSQIYGRAHKDR